MEQLTGILAGIVEFFERYDSSARLMRYDDWLKSIKNSFRPVHLLHHDRGRRHGGWKYQSVPEAYQ